jgi:hypothetical protein
MFDMFLCYMAKENKYQLAKSLIESDGIKNIQNLLAVVDKTPLSKDINTTAGRFNNLIENPVEFRFSDCIKIADVLKVDPQRIIAIVYAEILLKKKQKMK